MSVIQRLRSMVFLGIVGFVLPAAALAEVPRNAPAEDATLQAVLNRIHEHAASDAWKKPDFRDDEIEKWLDKFVGLVAKEAEFPELKLPVRLATLSRTGDVQGHSVLKSLLIGKSIDLAGRSVKDSIIFADGSVEAERLEGCIIVARGPVTARLTENSIIVSGAYVKILHEGTDMSRRSLIVSRGRAEINTTRGTFVVAPGGLDKSGIPILQDVVLINTPVKMIDQRAGFGVGRGVPPKELKIANLPLGPMPIHPLANKMELIGAVHRQITIPPRVPVVVPQAIRTEIVPVAAVFRHDGRRFVAERGQPIVDESGNPVTALRDWRLTFIDDKVAIFSSDDVDIVLDAAAK